MRGVIKVGLTAAVVAVAVVLVALKYWDYVVNPWTRDGQVRAYVIQVAPRVSGPIVQLPIVDNQEVSAGDLLFEIDPRTFQAAYDEAQANLDATVDSLSALDREIEAAQAVVDQAGSAIEQAQAQVKAADATLQEAARNLQRFQALRNSGDISIARYEAEERTYQVDLASKERADAALLQARSALMQAQADLETSIARRGALGDKNPQLRAATAVLEQDRLNLEFTQQRASVEGYVTNLNLRLGSQATANQPALALVDVKSFWVDAYFRETQVADIRPGDRAFVTLMSYPDRPLEARVESVAWGIAQDDGSTGSDLLPNVSPTFQWIRLAQRVPVRIALLPVPDDIALRVGTTASVLVMTGEGDGSAPALPTALQ